MPANFPIHLALTREQHDWLESEFERTGNLRSKIVQDLIDARRLGGASDVSLRKMLDGIARIEEQQQRISREMGSGVDVSLSLLREIFRESSANLYRLNAVIEDMPDSILVRQKVNEFVRGREREVLERTPSPRAEVPRG